MSSPEITPGIRYANLSSVINVLEGTAARIKLSSDVMRERVGLEAQTALTIGGAALFTNAKGLLAGDIDMHSALAAAAEETMRTAFDIVEAMGGMPMAYEDEDAETIPHKLVHGLHGYDLAGDTWLLLTTRPEQISQMGLGRPIPVLPRRTDQLRPSFEQAWKASTASVATEETVDPDTIQP